MTGIRRKRQAFWLIAVALLITGIGWASGSTTTDVDVQVEGGGSIVPGGKLATVTSLGANFTVERGQAQVIDGVELFQVDLASERFSDLVRIELLLLNPYDMAGVLSNPNSYIEVAVWHADASGEHTLNDGVTTVVKDEASVQLITRDNAAAVLIPTVAAKTRLYILARITVPGGAPPGSQDLAELNFHANVR
ncbi:MAG: hypothetical protein WD535_00875 [Thermaerobacterales bacterium]